MTDIQNTQKITTTTKEVHPQIRSRDEEILSQIGHTDDKDIFETVFIVTHD